MSKYKILDIQDAHTGEPKHDGLYSYYIGQICNILLPRTQWKDNRLIIHRFTGVEDGSVSILTTEVDKVVGSEDESTWEVTTLNTIYTFKEVCDNLKTEMP